ncbi:Ldh family oxidoreductase [Thioalkalivibrio sp. HK1]|uniref:Ldh family oxidoreductase n=1 Tax=Thioalkalivibrio sp. HK1 TaxID=1469245 RepID=UPI0009DE23A2|nr:Ldh family oxidoreductase [Thioalkalivibrio sp. HK1]
MKVALRHEGDEILVDARAMERLVGVVFERAGCESVEARRIARRLTGASLRGHDSHGVLRTHRYISWMQDDKVFAGRSVQIEHETDCLAVIDGRYGFGQTIGEQTVDLGVAKAKKHGVALTALKHSGHLGRIGDWAERAAQAGCASIHAVNVRGSLLVAPFGAGERRCGTSPLCFGLPRADGAPPIIHDFATSMVAEGKALVALRGGKTLPADALVDEMGNETSDPRPLYGKSAETEVPNPSAGPGALNVFGAHKGSGINFFMEMFAGALTGSGTAAVSNERERRSLCNGMFSVYIDLSSLGTADFFEREIEDYIEYWKSARPSKATGEVLIPGEKEERILRQRSEEGLPLSQGAWEDILAGARKVGMSDEDVEAALNAGLA